MAQNKPTEAELDILNVLWQREFATVREVYEILNQTKPMGYTTVLKIMQIMDDKGLVIRDTQTKAHYYRAKLQQKEAQQNYMRNLLDKVFGGSAKQLVLQALESNPASAEEMKEIRKILKQAEKDIKKDGEPKKKDKQK
jgi:BlaI family transcriptional regulator, penicillinase repressor